MPQLYYKTKKDSETGKLFTILIDRMDASKKALDELCTEFGAGERYSTNGWYAMDTGVNGFTFSKDPDPKIWKKVNKYPPLWFPKQNSSGKPFLEKIKNLDKIGNDELDAVVGRKSSMEHIGWNLGAKGDYYGFTLLYEWHQQMPKDCEEITGNQYMEL